MWDFAEANVFSSSTQNWMAQVEWVRKAIGTLPAREAGEAFQSDAASGTSKHSGTEIQAYVVSTDPPYYGNVPYADLSDFFYVWMRRSLRGTFPDLFSTITVPKDEELVAAPHRQGSTHAAQEFFLGGMRSALSLLHEQSSSLFPVTIYYAFKQSEASEEGRGSTGWETFLDAVIGAGFAISGTWPIRTERQGRTRELASNALASSIVLVCRARETDAPTATRREIQEILRAEFPPAVTHMQHANIAPVDLAQASIGPGMAVFSRYREVLNADGSTMSVREALALINETLDEVLEEQEGDFDADSRWALTWFEQHGYAEGEYGVAEQLSKAKSTSVEGLVRAGVVESRRGAVRILKPSELNPDWDPETDSRLTVWEMTQQLIRLLESGGERAAGALAAKLGSQAETARELAYRLYVVSERKRRSTDALAYNGLVQSWPEIVRLAGEARAAVVEQGALAIDGAQEATT